MVVLTEDMVAKAKGSTELADILNFNCWGMELTDLSIIEKLEKVEVLSLRNSLITVKHHQCHLVLGGDSINNIKTLKYFRHNIKLRELYLRRNDIADLSELGYLAQLMDLKVLWLSHNPVAENPDYRASVIRLLPHLIKLDDKDVTADELVQAKKSGVVIPAKDVDDEAEAELAEANNADNVRGSGGEVEGDADAEVGAGEAALTAIKALLPLLSPKQLAEVSSAIALQQ